MSLRLQTNSVDETIALGERLGACLEEGDVLVLSGDLGAGKTQLTKGIASALGVTDDVTSPTFTIQMLYEGDALDLNHFDLYRLEDPSQLEDTGIFDVLGEDGICVIEWGERFLDELGDEHLDISITRLEDKAAAGKEPPRELCFEATGKRSNELLARLEAALGSEATTDPAPSPEKSGS